MIGSPAPDFTIRDADRTVSLHDFHGKIIILNFWESWCLPCIEETPSMIRLHERMPQVVILGVSTESDDRAYHKFLIDQHVNYLTVRDGSRHSSDLYGTTGQPETFIIDAAGIVRRKFAGPEDWTSPAIIDYLNKL